MSKFIKLPNGEYLWKDNIDSMRVHPEMECMAYPGTIIPWRVSIREKCGTYYTVKAQSESDARQMLEGIASKVIKKDQSLIKQIQSCVLALLIRKEKINSQT